MTLFQAYALFSAHADIAFGLLVALIAVASVLANDITQFRLGLVLLGAWATTDIAAAILGFGSDTMRTVASLDAVAAVFVAIIGYEARSRVALIVFALYGLVFLAHVLAAVFGGQTTNTYYAVLNVLFFLQLVTVGSSSARCILAHRRARRHQRPGAVPVGGAGVATSQ